MCWPAIDEDPVVKTIIHYDISTAKRVVQCSARENDAKVRSGVRMQWTYRSCSDDDLVGAAVVCKHSNEWCTRQGYLATEHMLVFNAKL